MLLSTEDIVTLSRWFDEMQPLPPGERKAWLAARPTDRQHLLPHLRAMLDATPESLLSTQLPALEAESDDVSLPQAGENVGPYRLLHEIGRGGMGSVWLAERADGIYERQVALKLPRLVRGPRLAERMALERRIGARLEHPNIARLYDAGIDAIGRPYLVLEYVAGERLLDHATRTALDRDARLMLLLQACAAASHAHRQLIVHRDIKPSNLMVDAHGQLRLLDFGIAKLLDAEDGIAGDLMQRTHTPGYAAPEQLRGEPVTTATDQYALAVVGHELLTGHLPKAGRPGAALERDLRVVLSRALQAHADDRYASVAHFADDLRCVLEHRPVSTDPGPQSHRLALLLRRQTAVAAAAGVALLALLLGGGMALQQQRLAREEASRTAQAREFLFDLMEDTEPLEGQAVPAADGSDRLRAAIERARASFEGQPALRGDVLVQLGLLLRRVGTPEEAHTALRDGYLLLRSAADPGDPALARARAQLAQQLLQQQDVNLDEVASLARAAIDDCRRDPLRCAKARAYAEQALMQVALRRGEIDDALRHATDSVQAHVAGFGERDPETVLARLTLAIALRNGGHLPEAAAALETAQAAASDLRLRAADRVQMQLWQAVVSADLGRHADALAALDTLLATSSSGPGVATWHRLRAQSLFEQQRWPAALEEAELALSLANAADNHWEQALTRQARGRALAALGRHGEAFAELERTGKALQALGARPGSIEQLRLQRLLAEAALHAGDLTRAASLLAPLPDAHRAASPKPLAPIDLAQVRLLQGTLARLEGKLADARARCADAAPLLAVLPAAHPLRRRQAVEAALVDALVRGPAEPLRAATRQWLAELSADAGNRRALQRLIDDPASGRSLVL